MRNTRKFRSGEEVVFETRPHFLMYLKSALIKFIVILFLIYFFRDITSLAFALQNFIINHVQFPLVQSVTIILLVLVFVLFLWIIWDLLSWKYTSYIITNTKIISKKGILRKKRSSIHFNKVQDIRVSQGIIERVIASGDIEIYSGHDLSTMKLYDVPDPDKVEDLINRAIEGDFEFKKSFRKSEKNGSVVSNYERKFRR
ncbi:MAG: PH domain-containing protein [Methanobacterium sp.]|jgi:uncharacterized membrane protein YdbT with pleckstrin-like domain